MSGFVGTLHFDGSPVDHRLLQRLSKLLLRRGPDEDGIWVQGNVGLGHALLRTTVESEHEQQPYTFAQHVWIIADARLDGRSTLIQSLRAKDRVLDKHAPDVELILHAYHIWGEDCLQHLIGDFTFAIWDGHKQKLFCARDHFGVFPFYYARVGNRMVFSNTLECLLLHPDVSDKLNEQAIGDFLLFGMNMDVRTTPFAGIERLPPAHYLACTRQGGIRVGAYWSLPEQGDFLRYKKAEDYVEHFREHFRQAVADRLRTNRLGTHLSGGLDSTSIAATAHRLLTADGKPFEMRAYTIVYEHLFREEEGRYAQMVADRLGLPHELLVAEDYLNRAPADQPEYLLPEPCVIPNRVAELEIRRRVATYSRVLLQGFGGDPALYPARSYWRDLLKQKQWRQLFRGIWHFFLIQKRLPHIGLRTHIRQAFRRSGDSPHLAVPDWLHPDFVARLDLPSRQTEVYARMLSQRDRYGMVSPFWSNLFAWSDAISMWYPGKARYPFFDLRLVSFLLRVPPEPWFEEKKLLRHAMQGRLPDAVLQRPKTPLGRPQDEGTAQQHAQRWRTELVNTPPVLKSYVNTDLVRQRIQASTQEDRYELERVYPVAYWLHHYPASLKRLGSPYGLTNR